jgi:hypothetical protein
VNLPFEEQLELLSRLTSRLMKNVPHPVMGGRKKVAQKVASILRECDSAALAFKQRTDSAEAIRRIRDKRHAHL